MYEFKCPTCKEVISIERRSHYCKPVKRMAVYIPRVNLKNKQIDPAYRKRFGSRPKK
jgi:hypothetical protein